MRTIRRNAPDPRRVRARMLEHPGRRSASRSRLRRVRQPRIEPVRRFAFPRHPLFDSEQIAGLTRRAAARISGIRAHRGTRGASDDGRRIGDGSASGRAAGAAADAAEPAVRALGGRDAGARALPRRPPSTPSSTACCSSRCRFPTPARWCASPSDYKALDLRDVGLSQPELEDYARRSGAFESIAGIWPITANLTGSDRPERVEVLLASANYFDLLGVAPALGRTFTMRDEIPGIATVAVISDALWRRGFGGDPQVLGRKLRIDEDVYEIIGVMPASFRHPSADARDRRRGVGADRLEGRAVPASRPTARGSCRRRSAGSTPGMSIDAARSRAREPRRRAGARAPRPVSRRGSAGRRGSTRSPPISSPTVRPALLVLMGGIALRDADRHLEHLEPAADSRGGARARGRRAARARRVALARDLERARRGRACWRWPAARSVSSPACGASICCCVWCPTGCRACRTSAWTLACSCSRC